jgi:hypothetical protein
LGETTRNPTVVHLGVLFGQRRRHVKDILMMSAKCQRRASTSPLPMLHRTLRAYMSNSVSQSNPQASDAVSSAPAEHQHPHQHLECTKNISLNSTVQILVLFQISTTTLIMKRSGQEALGRRSHRPYWTQLQICS